MKFGEIIVSVATLTIIDVLLYAVFLMVFVPSVSTLWGPDVSASLAIFIASLIVGFVFAGQIQETRLSSIGRIAVLSAIVTMLMMGALFTNPYMGDSLKEALESMYSTAGWTTTDWLGYSTMAMVFVVALNVVLTLVLSFVGVYAGSMLRRGKKS